MSIAHESDTNHAVRISNIQASRSSEAPSARLHGRPSRVGAWSVERGAWSVERGAWSVERGAWSVERDAECGSTFIIVLWVAFGLVSMALYFANSMSFELRASDNRVSGLSAEQAIQGAVRYVNYLLATQIANGSNGFLLDPAGYQSQAVS